MYVVAVTTKSSLCSQSYRLLPLGTTVPLIAIGWWFDRGRFVLSAIKGDSMKDNNHADAVVWRHYQK